MKTAAEPRGRIAAALLLFLAGLLAAGCRPPAAASAGAAAAAPRAAAKAAVSIRNLGSDTLVNLALAWAEAYMSAHPEVRISVTGGGSGTGHHRADQRHHGHRQRLPADEPGGGRGRARATGFEPVEHAVALDAIAVVVNPSNPVGRLTLRQVSDLYTARLPRWSELGGEDRPIVLLSRESNSGTYVYFLEQVIRLGEESDKLFSPETLLMPSSEGISTEVRRNPNAIGYDGLGYVTADQKTIARLRRRLRPVGAALGRDGARRLLPGRPPAVHVHRGGGDGPRRRLPRLDRGRGAGAGHGAGLRAPAAGGGKP